MLLGDLDDCNGKLQGSGRESGDQQWRRSWQADRPAQEQGEQGRHRGLPHVVVYAN